MIAFEVGMLLQHPAVVASVVPVKGRQMEMVGNLAAVRGAGAAKHLPSLPVPV